MVGMAAALTLSPNAVWAAELLGLDLSRHPFTGDFDGIMARGFVRILAPYSRTLLFQDKGSFHGVAAEAAEELEKYIRRTYPALKQKFVVVLIPTSRDRLLPDLLAGLGDIAAGDITITPDRQKVVSFTTPTYSGIKELVVTAAGAPPLSSAEDLSGKEIAARPTTSTYASLVALNERLAAAGRPEATIIDLPPVLEVEDMMEMVAAGLLPAIPAEDWVADLWLPLVPGLQCRCITMRCFAPARKSVGRYVLPRPSFSRCSTPSSPSSPPRHRAGTTSSPTTTSKPGGCTPRPTRRK